MSWFITASNFRTFYYIYIYFAELSKDLIMSICYPSKSRFSKETKVYESNHKDVTRDTTEYLSNIPENISMRESGLF